MYACPNIPAKVLPTQRFYANMAILFLSQSHQEAMKNMSRLALLLAPLVLVACSKKEETAPAPAVVVAPAAAPAAPAAPVEKSADQAETDERQQKLDYGIMEDKYINDARGQWATGASASSTYGDPKPSDSNLAPNALPGPPDEKYWINKSQDVGFEWAEFTYDKPVQASEVRLVINDGNGVEAISKVELQDTEGKWNTVWTGLSDVKRDRRGNRTWFVRTFEKTPYKVKAVKYTIANNVERGYKYFDAAQLVGD